MPRIARVVIPDVPHHITQRGNRRQPTFFCDDDYVAYLDLIREGCDKTGTQLWAYCLMPNHVHLLLVPQKEDGLRAAISEAHRKYTKMVNFRYNWRGHLWQDRFASFPADERHALEAIRYMELNPVRARLVPEAEDYEWSSAKAHMSGVADKYADATQVIFPGPDWRKFLAEGMQADALQALRGHERTGRPLGNPDFIARLEGKLGRTFTPQKPGPKTSSG